MSWVGEISPAKCSLAYCSHAYGRRRGKPQSLGELGGARASDRDGPCYRDPTGPGVDYEHTLAGLPTFCPITFHLLFSYSLIAFNNAWLCLRGASQHTRI